MYEARQRKEKVSRTIVKPKGKDSNHCMLSTLQMFEDWSVDGSPKENNNRTELNIKSDEGNIVYNVNVSNRHNIINYYVAYNQDTYDSKDLNTIVLSSSYFLEGISDFAKAIKNELNKRNINDGSYDTKNIPGTYPKTDNLNPFFESDRAGTNVHSYPIGNEESAITLTKNEHISLKLILRGIFANTQHGSYRIAKAEWLNNSNNHNIRKVIIDTLHLDWKTKKMEDKKNE